MKVNQFPKHNNEESLAGSELELVDRSDFVDTMSRVANSVNVVTTSGSGGEVGVTVSAATSVTAEPPTLLVCIHEQSKAAAAILENGVFCLNVLESAQQHYAELFAGLTAGSTEDRFNRPDWTQLKTGAPALKNGLAVFDCRLDAVLKEGTHYIFVGQVVATNKGSGVPLIYSQRAYAQPAWLNERLPE
jgi:flavin reductase